EAFVAGTRRTVAATRGTSRRTHAAGVAPARAPRRVAVDEVAQTGMAERRVVGLPPAGGHGPGWARVLPPVDGAAERGPSRRAGRIGSAQRCVRGAGPQEV